MENKIVFYIKKGFFIAYDGKTSYEVWTDDRRDFNYMPDLETVYRALCARGYDSSKVIDLMLSIFHPQRLLKGDHLTDMAIVSALVGGRGSGKSAGATILASLDYMMAGYPVWSNMPIEFTVQYGDAKKRFSNLELDKATLLNVKDMANYYKNGLVLVDEINIELSEARRSMSKKALRLHTLLQQIRKRYLDMMFTCQNEEWEDNRTRWQTDIYISCFDPELDKESPKRDRIGHYSDWTYYNTSGVMGTVKTGKDKKVLPYKFRETWRRPFWECYDHEKIYGADSDSVDAAIKYEVDLNKIVSEDVGTTDKRIAHAILEAYEESGVDRLPGEELRKKMSNATGRIGRSLNKLLGMVAAERGWEHQGRREFAEYVLKKELANVRR